jgi:hypothetical protein
MNEPELGAEITPGMAFNPFPSSILDKTRQNSNPQPYLRTLLVICSFFHKIAARIFL